MPENNIKTKEDLNFAMQIPVTYKCRHCGADNQVIGTDDTEYQCQSCQQITPKCDLIFFS